MESTPPSAAHSTQPSAQGRTEGEEFPSELEVITAQTPANVSMSVDVDKGVELLPERFLGAGSFGRVYECVFQVRERCLAGCPAAVDRAGSFRGMPAALPCRISKLRLFVQKFTLCWGPSPALQGQRCAVKLMHASLVQEMGTPQQPDSSQFRKEVEIMARWAGREGSWCKL